MDTLIQKIFLYMMRIPNVLGELTGVSAGNESPWYNLGRNRNSVAKIVDLVLHTRGKVRGL